MAGNGNKGTQRTPQLEECSMASPLMSPCRQGLCSKSCGGHRSLLHVVCGLMCTLYRYELHIRYDKYKRQVLFGLKTNSTLYTFTEGTALPRDLDGVLAALFAGHGRAVRFSIHTLAEGAVVLFPLLLMGSQLIIHPAAGLSAVHRQQLHI